MRGERIGCDPARNMLALCGGGDDTGARPADNPHVRHFVTLPEGMTERAECRLRCGASAIGARPNGDNRIGSENVYEMNNSYY